MKKRVLIYRLSSMGDVAMLASVLKEACKQNLNHEFIIVSHHFFEAFFLEIENVLFHGFYPKSKHKGVKGLLKLHRELQVYRADKIADLHGNIRTKILGMLSSLNGHSYTKTIDKGREAKKEIIKTKRLKQLKPTVERYADVFRALGLKAELSHQLPKVNMRTPSQYSAIVNHTKYNIGISPFAQWKYKMWPLSKMKELINQLASYDSTALFIFGGGEKEKEMADDLARKHKNVVNTIGTLSLKEELELISNIDLMLSMDSSGMHMASLVGVRCISLWGTTHPFLGFLGYGQSINDCIQVDHPNRPCSVYGNKSCLCEGLEAIDLIKPQIVLQKVNAALYEI